MPRQIGRDDVRAMSAGGVVVVDVLPAPEYEDEHLPGVINIPLKKPRLRAGSWGIFSTNQRSP